MLVGTKGHQLSSGWNNMVSLTTKICRCTIVTNKRKTSRQVRLLYFGTMNKSTYLQMMMIFYNTGVNMLISSNWLHWKIKSLFQLMISFIWMSEFRVHMVIPMEHSEPGIWYIHSIHILLQSINPESLDQKLVYGENTKRVWLLITICGLEPVLWLRDFGIPKLKKNQ